MGISRAFRSVRRAATPADQHVPGGGGASRKPSENATNSGEGLRIGGARVDLREGRVRAADGTETELRPQSASVLRALAARRGQTVSKDDLHAAVWGDIAVTDDSLVQCIGDIRRALSADRDALQTLPKRGYRLAPEDAAGTGRAWVPLGAAALALILLIAGWMVWTARDPAPSAGTGFQGPAVAVLPFENRAGGERWERLAQGLTEDVIADLARNAWLFVLADATTRAYAGKPPAEIAEKLGVRHLVEGRVQAGDGQVRISAVLVEAASGRQVWSRDWVGAEGDFLRLQREAAEELASELASNWSGPISRSELARAKGMGTDNLGAYELARLGMEHGHRFTPEDFRQAVALFEQAVRLDPGYGDARAHLSWALPFLIFPDTPPDERQRITEAANAAAMAAYRLAPDLPKPIIQAARLIGPTDAGEGERMVRRAVAVAPNNADNIAYAACQAAWAPAIAVDAEAWVRRAMQLNPAHPGWYDWCLADVMWTPRRYAEAAVSYERAPPTVEAHAMAAAGWALAGDADRAADALARAIAVEPGFTIAWFRSILVVHDDFWTDVVRGLRLAGAPEGTVAEAADAAAAR